jgi:hypothetical protein
MSPRQSNPRLSAGVIGALATLLAGAAPVWGANGSPTPGPSGTYRVYVRATADSAFPIRLFVDGAPQGALYRDALETTLELAPGAHTILAREATGTREFGAPLEFARGDTEWVLMPPSNQWPLVPVPAEAGPRPPLADWGRLMLVAALVLGLLCAGAVWCLGRVRVPHTHAQTVEKVAVVVVVDRARSLESVCAAEALAGSAGSRAQAELTRGDIVRALATEGIHPRTIPYQSTGDGTLFIVDCGAQAVRVIEHIHQEADAANQKVDYELARRHYRVGVCTGVLLLTRKETPAGELDGYEIAGAVLGEAKRLESACATGEVLICPRTWAALPDDARALFGAVEPVFGKYGEKYFAHRRRVVPPASWEATQQAAPELAAATGSHE